MPQHIGQEVLEVIVTLLLRRLLHYIAQLRRFIHTPCSCRELA